MYWLMSSDHLYIVASPTYFAVSNSVSDVKYILVCYMWLMLSIVSNRTNSSRYCLDRRRRCTNVFRILPLQYETGIRNMDILWSDGNIITDNRTLTKQTVLFTRKTQVF